MRNSEELLAKAGIIPKLRLAIKEEGIAPRSTGAHRVKILEDKIMNAKNHEGKIVPIVRYIMEEDGEKKRYDVEVKDKNGDLHYLVQRLAEVKEGQEIILEMKKRGMKNYVSVSVVGHSSEVEMDDEEPMIDIDEPGENEK